MAPTKRKNPVETYNSSRLRRVKEALRVFPKRSAITPFLTSACTAMKARAYWMAVGILVALGILFFWNTSSIIEINKSQVQLRLLLSELQGFIATVSDAETGQRGYLLVGAESYLEPYRNAVKVADQEIDRVEKLMNAVPGQRSTFDALRHLTALKFSELKETVQLRQSAGIYAAMQVVRTDRGKKLMDELRGLVDQIKKEIQQRLAKHDRLIATLAGRATRWGILGSMLAGIMFVSAIQRERRERTQVVERARQLARSVEMSRVQNLKQSNGKSTALGQRTRDLAAFVATVRLQPHNQSNDISTPNDTWELPVLGRLADFEVASQERDACSYFDSHDLHAALRAIDGFSRIVLEDYGASLASEGKAYLQLVRDNARQMGQLVDNLLAFARLDHPPRVTRPVDPDKMARRYLAKLAKELQDRPVETVIGDR